MSDLFDLSFQWNDRKPRFSKNSEQFEFSNAVVSLNYSFYSCNLGHRFLFLCRNSLSNTAEAHWTRLKSHNHSPAKVMPELFER